MSALRIAANHTHTHLLENAVTTSTDQKKALQDSGAVRTKVHTITTSTDQKNALQDSGAVRTKVMSHSASERPCAHTAKGVATCGLHNTCSEMQTVKADLHVIAFGLCVTDKLMVVALQALLKEGRAHGVTRDVHGILISSGVFHHLCYHLSLRLLQIIKQTVGIALIPFILVAHLDRNSLYRLVHVLGGYVQ